uniref:Prolactin 2 n=1 Tax=Gadus morhua TaxID=8049 RepID=A0A8C5C1N3_GADMO
MQKNKKDEWSFAWLGALCLVLRTPTDTVRAAPICDNGQASCQVLSLADLFDRVIQHSSRMHGMSNDLHSQFEQYFLPSRNHISNRVNRNCHTSGILTPNGKENAQRLAVKELTEVILKLLWAWRDPLWHFHQSMAHHDDFNSFSSNKALVMGDLVHELRTGVEKVAEKMQNLGIISNLVNGLRSPEQLLPSPVRPQWSLMNDYDLLFCLRRDSNKVQSYLKILKCRIVPENDC